MEVAMEEAGLLSGCSSTTTTLYNDLICAWSDWNTVVDWGPFSAVADDFHELMESMMYTDDAVDDLAGLMSTTQSPSYNSNLSITTTSASTPAEEDVNTGAGGCLHDDDKGLRLVHLLLAAAEALAGPHKSPELARVILVRLKELAAHAGAGCGTSMERLAAHFTDALQGLLDGAAHAHCGGRSSFRDAHLHHHTADVLTAFQLLQDMSPYIKFAHFTANQAILEDTLGDRRVHIVDYDIAEGLQWASLMQALVSRPDGAPPPHLRITAVSRGGSRAMQETGRRLAAFAASIGQPFSFSQCRLDADERFRPAGVKVVKGETVVMNCALHPTMGAARRVSAGSVASFLSGAAALGAKVVTLVEDEEEEEERDDFVARFMGELHRYSAVWDSLEAGFPMQGRARAMVERFILGPRIAGAVGRAYREGKEGEERDGGWGEWMAAMGFGRVSISCFNHCQSKLLLGLFNDGYKVEEDGINKLVLGWKSRRLLSASVWKPPRPLLPSSPPSPIARACNIVNPAGLSTLGFEDSDFFCD